jgi:hypothetical protein
MLIPILLSGLVVFLTHALEAATGFGCAAGDHHHYHPWLVFGSLHGYQQTEAA